jgi:hypothetical protein
MDEKTRRHMLHNDPDFILLKRFDFSLTKALARYPDGMKDELIAAALGISEKAVSQRYDDIVAKLREELDA